MSLSYWDVDRYRAGWTRSLGVLVEGGDGAISCLVTSIHDPADSNFVFCWPVYRSGKRAPHDLRVGRVEGGLGQRDRTAGTLGHR
ncbi:hypothetical protein ABZ320_13085, partial [Micrococcus luteus]